MDGLPSMTPENHHSDSMLRRDELDTILGLSPAVIDALVQSGAVERHWSGDREVVACSDLERLFRDTLLNLYRAQARATVVTKDAVAIVNAPETEIEIDGEPIPVILRTADEERGAAAEVPEADLRFGARYRPRRQLGGTFRDVKFNVLQLSNSGLRIRHGDPLRPGEEARLSFAVLNPPRSFVVRARVVWTSIAQRDDEPSYCVSGLTVIGNADRLTTAIELLRTSRELQLDEEGARRGKRGNDAMPRPVSGLADEDVVSIIQAMRRFTNDPVEATRWYTRARFAISDEEVRKNAPRGAREREEVVGVWEYLQRRVDLRAVAGVLQWMRRTSVAAV